ncbi:1-acyldihydroxyacetone-phosphate reductase [Fusarium coicis]|nr:1-acyldihydroxyacetone-phosphate reductase [Fusarium coicis]
MRTFKQHLPFHASAWEFTSEPVQAFLNEPNPQLRDALTATWKENMTWQLNVIIVTSSVVCSLIAGAFSWPHFEAANSESTCIQLTKAAWYSAMIFSIASIAAGSQLLLALHRISCYPNSQEMVRGLLIGRTACAEAINSTAAVQASRRYQEQVTSQAYLWQIPVMLLNGSLYMFAGGLCIIAYWDIDRALRAQKNWSACLFSGPISRSARPSTHDSKMTTTQALLQQKLTITPKTASLLMQAGFSDYRELKYATPNGIVEQFTSKFGIPKTSASAYRRACRRLVFLGTQENPEDQEKICADWTNKALAARGIWRPDFDDLTGEQIAELLMGTAE